VKKIWIIASKDVSEAFRSRSIYLVGVVGAIFAFSFGAAYNRNLAANASAAVITGYSRDFLSMVVYIVPLMYSIIICNVFSNYTVVLDKARRNIESLMATPVSIKQVWLGKSLSVVLPSLVLGLGVSIIVFLGFEFVLVIPNAHAFIVPEALSFVTALIVVPVLIFTIVSVVTNIQLVIANPRIANLVFTAIFILLVLGFNLLGKFGATMSYFALAYLGVAALCVVIDLILSRSLTKEKVLLSSKD
jgi:ABC-2 type transport system permease protein